MRPWRALAVLGLALVIGCATPRDTPIPPVSPGADGAPGMSGAGPAPDLTDAGGAPDAARADGAPDIPYTGGGPDAARADGTSATGDRPATVPAPPDSASAGSAIDGPRTALPEPVDTAPTCVASWKASCDECGGTIACDGLCDARAPRNFGTSCDSCGGTIGCDGSCQSKAAANAGKPCDECGGTFTCDGTCLSTAAANHGKSCTTCTDKIGCDGRCVGPSFQHLTRTVTLTAAQPDDPVAGMKLACPAGFRYFQCYADCRYADGRQCLDCATAFPTDPATGLFCDCFAVPGATLPVTCTVSTDLMRIGCESIPLP
jgi:hypothetical protein